jgi:hypothetical protein
MPDIPQTVVSTPSQELPYQQASALCGFGGNNRFHIWFGVPAVLINVVLVSTFFVLLTKEIPVGATWSGAFGADATTCPLRPQADRVSCRFSCCCFVIVQTGSLD